jgi:protein SCO1/2
MASCCSTGPACDRFLKAPVILGLLLCLVSGGCARPKMLPVYGNVPDFRLISQTGAPFERASLNGKIWVADFIFTHCTTSCPRMSSQMARVQSFMAEFPDVRLVSFSVDPQHDTPEALAVYARRYQAQPGRWFFLTGDQKTLDALDRRSFMLGDVDGSLEHSTRFVLVDRRGRIRAYYGAAQDDPSPGLIVDIRRLERER